MNFMYKNHFEVNARISMVFIFKVTPKLRTLLLANLSLIQNRFRNELQQFFFDCCQSQQILFTIADFWNDTFRKVYEIWHDKQERQNI